MTRFRLILRGVFHPASRFVLTMLVTGVTTAAALLYLVLASGIDTRLERERKLLGADLLVIPESADFEPEETLMAGARITFKDGREEYYCEMGHALMGWRIELDGLTFPKWKKDEHGKKNHDTHGNKGHAPAARFLKPIARSTAPVPSPARKTAPWHPVFF